MAKDLVSRMHHGPFTKAWAATPNDSEDEPYNTRGFYVGGAGNVTVIFAGDADGAQVTLTGLLPGVVYEMAVRRFFATGLTASNLIALA